MSATVSVLAPGLEGPATGNGAGDAQAARALLADLPLPGFEALLRRFRSSRQPAVGGTLPRLGAGLLGVSPGPEETFPAAALSRAAFPEHDDVGAAVVWMRADPVHLRADMGKLIVFPPEVLSLSLDEASRMVDWLAARAHFPGPRVELLTPSCWVCAPDGVPRMNTVSPRAAYGTNAREVMAHGEDAGRWNGYMNEIQMLLHQCPVNEERERSGLPAVNSLWYWGAGALPPVPSDEAEYDAVWSDEPVLAGAARRYGVAVKPLPASGEAWCRDAPVGRHLLALDTLELPARAQDLDAWREAIRRLDEDWLKPLADALDAGRATSVDIHSTQSVAHARRATLWSRWRRGADAVQILARLRQGMKP